MDWLVYLVGVIVLLVTALLFYKAGMKQGSKAVNTEEKDLVSLRGLSQPSKDFVIDTFKRRWIWEEERGPNRNKYKRVHCD